jgi:hypothetical protein
MLASEFSHALQRLISPDVIARDIVAEILTDDNDGQLQSVPNFTQELSTRLQQVPNSTTTKATLDFLIIWRKSQFSNPFS